MRRNSNGISARVLVMAVALTLIIGGIIGGSVAWLTAKTEPVVNTFTYGDIDITLTETTGESYKIIPGVDISKNPKVAVTANSEACWLFVKVKQTGTFVEGEVTYSVITGENGWAKGDGTSIPANVYYREVSAADAEQGVSYNILSGNDTYPDGVITVSDTLTKENIESITNPTLTFTAYAVQKDGVADAATAWAKVNS